MLPEGVLSITHVVRATMEVYGKGWNLTPPPPATHKPLNRWSPKFVYVTKSGYLHHAKFYPNQFRGFGSAHAWFHAPRHKVTRLQYFFWEVLEKGYCRDARSDFDAKYVKRRGSTQGSAFWGSQNQYLRFRPLFPQKSPFLGPISTGLQLENSSVVRILYTKSY